MPVLERRPPHDVLDLLGALVERWEAQLAAPEQAVRVWERTGRRREHDHEAVLRLAAEGLTDRQIGERLGGISAATVRTIRRTHGARTGYSPPTGQRSWEAPLRELHGRGLLVPEIAAETGWTVQTVRQRLSVLRLRAHRLPAEP